MDYKEAVKQFRRAAEIIGCAYGWQGTCPALAVAIGVPLFDYNGIDHPVFNLWREMHRPRSAFRSCDVWFGPIGNTENGELREALLLEAALNLEAQGFSE